MSVTAVANLPAFAFPRSPTAAPQIRHRERASTVRHIDCAHYNACLDDAYARRWDGFGCGGCRAFVRISPEQARADLAGIAQLWASAPNEEKARIESDKERAHAAHCVAHNRRLRVIRGAG